MGEFFRIGDKLLSRKKLDTIIDRIFDLRVAGAAQQEVAQRVGCDRSFISRLESLAEVRKGGSLAVIGFPLANKEVLQQVCAKYGVEYTLLMDNKERWGVVEGFDGKRLLDWLMGVIADVSDFDHVIMIGSDMRIKLAEAILGDKVFGITLGRSPIREDCHLDPAELQKLIISIKGD